MRIGIPAIARLAQKITVSDIGCWELPLPAEYDDKRRARYPQITDREAGAKNLLAHRYVARVALGATLGPLNFIDHICRVHACCNVTHFDFVTRDKTISAVSFIVELLLAKRGFSSNQL